MNIAIPAMVASRNSLRDISQPLIPAFNDFMKIGFLVRRFQIRISGDACKKFKYKGVITVAICNSVIT